MVGGMTGSPHKKPPSVVRTIFGDSSVTCSSIATSSHQGQHNQRPDRITLRAIAEPTARGLWGMAVTIGRNPWHRSGCFAPLSGGICQGAGSQASLKQTVIKAKTRV
jgi:hypothetical protein